MTSLTAALEIIGLNAWYGESHVLHGIDLQVEPGEVVCLLGRNGAGRTTTLRAILGLTSRTGPIAGAAVIVNLQNYLANLGGWSTITTGVIFVVCVLAFRRGIIGEISHRLKIQL